MARRNRKATSGMRLRLGASVLSAARGVDTRLVKDRLGRFERVHRRYVDAQRKVDAAESQLRAAQARLEESEALQDEAVEMVARTLVMDGEPRANPFEAVGTPAPSVITRLPSAEEVQAVHALAAAVQRSTKVSKATFQAAQAADKAAQVVEQALAAVAKQQDGVRDARRLREAVGQGWEAALAALKRVAQAAAKEGAPDLYATLFPPVVRPTTKSKAPEEQAPAVTATPTAA